MSSSSHAQSHRYNSLQTQQFNLQATTAKLDGNNILTGTNQFVIIPTTETATSGDSSNQIANTEFVQTAISNIPDILVLDNTFTGTNYFEKTPTTDTAPQLDSSSKVATTSYVDTAVSNLFTNDLVFNGQVDFSQTPTTETMAPLTNSIFIATTAYVDTAISVIPDLLISNNTFTGTNDFTEQVSFTLPPHSAPPLLGNDLATKGYVDSLVGQYSGGLNLFLNYSQPVEVGGQPYYSISKQVSAASQQSITVSTVVGDNLLVTFISNELNITEIPAGLFDLFLYGAVSSPSQIVFYRFILKKYSDGVITTIASSGNSKDVNASPSNNPEVYLTNATISLAEPMLLTDRIIIEIYYDKTGGASVDLTTYFESAYYSFVQSTLNAGTTLLTSDNNWTANNNFELSPTVPTVSAGDNSYKVASTEFVTTAISNITPAVNYIDASGNASGSIHMVNHSIDFLNTNGANNTITATTQNITGYDGEYVENYISSASGPSTEPANYYVTKMTADANISEITTSFFDSNIMTTTELTMSVDITPNIGAVSITNGVSSSSPITVKSDLDMDQNSITNIPSIASSSTLSITSTGVMTIDAGTGQTIDLKGNIQINSSSGTLNQVLTSTGESTSPIWSIIPENPNTVALVTPPDPSFLKVVSKLIVSDSNTLPTTSTIGLISSDTSGSISIVYDDMSGGILAWGATVRELDVIVSSNTPINIPLVCLHNGKTYLQANNSTIDLVSDTGFNTLNIGNNLCNINTLSSTLALSSTGDMTIGNADINTNLEGVVNVKNDLIVGSGASSVRLFGGDGGDIFDNTTQNDIQLRLAGRQRNQIYNAVIPITATAGGIIILPTALNGYYVYIINGSNFDWFIKPQVGEFIGQGLAGAGVGNPSGGIIARAFQTFGFVQLVSGVSYNLIVNEAINGTQPTFPAMFCGVYEGTNNSAVVPFATAIGAGVRIGKASFPSSINGFVKLPNLAVSNYTFRRNTVVQAIPNGSDTIVLFPSLITSATASSLTYSAGTFTNNTAGNIMCQITYSVGFGTNSSGIRTTKIICSTYGVSGGIQMAPLPSNITTLNGSVILSVPTTVSFNLTAFQSSGASINLDLSLTSIQILVL